jgi:processing peptidase subunit beta
MAWNQPATKVTTLPNGVKVATKETFGEMASVGVFIDAGVRDETPDTKGAAFLVEQLALSGTSRRSKTDLETEVESMGGTLSVTTGREQSSYMLSCFRSDVKQGVDILSDLVTSVPVENWESSKEAILSAYEESDTPTRALIEDRLHQCAYRDYSLGYSSTGPYDNVDGLTAAHLKSYVDASFTADKMVLVGTGAVDHGALVSMAEASLGSIGKGPVAPYVESPYFCGAELIYRNDEMGPTAHISVGWKTVPWKSGDAVAFMVMEYIIGKYTKNTGVVPGNISGNRTINAVANKMQVGCADSFEAFNCFYRDTGMLVGTQLAMRLLSSIVSVSSCSESISSPLASPTKKWSVANVS